MTFFRLMVYILTTASRTSQGFVNEDKYVCRCEKFAYENKPFVAIWNSPTNGCDFNFSTPINLKRFGIIENDHQTWDGKHVTVFASAQLGLYPYFILNGEKNYNGGLPQAVDLGQHLRKARKDIEAKIPDPNYTGLAVIDWEQWRPLWDTNWTPKKIYKLKSVEMVRSKHPDWTLGRIMEEAKKQFEESARALFEHTITIGKELRPKALWGFYGFPDCYGIEKEDFQCVEKTKKQNDQLEWLFSASSALFPSMYLQNRKPGNHNFVLGRLRETLRFATKGFGSNKRNIPIFVYHRNIFDADEHAYQFLQKPDLDNTIALSADFGTAGIVLWGNRFDENTSPEVCRKIENYVHSTLGPYLQRKFVETQQCATTKCNNHGHCVDKALLTPELLKRYQSAPGARANCSAKPVSPKPAEIAKLVLPTQHGQPTSGDDVSNMLQTLRDRNREINEAFLASQNGLSRKMGEFFDTIYANASIANSTAEHTFSKKNVIPKSKTQNTKLQNVKESGTLKQKSDISKIPAVGKIEGHEVKEGETLKPKSDVSNTAAKGTTDGHQIKEEPLKQKSDVRSQITPTAKGVSQVQHPAVAMIQASLIAANAKKAQLAAQVKIQQTIQRAKIPPAKPNAVYQKTVPVIKKPNKLPNAAGNTTKLHPQVMARAPHPGNTSKAIVKVAPRIQQAMHPTPKANLKPGVVLKTPQVLAVPKTQNAKPPTLLNAKNNTPRPNPPLPPHKPNGKNVVITKPIIKAPQLAIAKKIQLPAKAKIRPKLVVAPPHLKASIVSSLKAAVHPLNIQNAQSSLNSTPQGLHPLHIKHIELTPPSLKVNLSHSEALVKSVVEPTTTVMTNLSDATLLNIDKIGKPSKGELSAVPNVKKSDIPELPDKDKSEVEVSIDPGNEEEQRSALDVLGHAASEEKKSGGIKEDHFIKKSQNSTDDVNASRKSEIAKGSKGDPSWMIMPSKGRRKSWIPHIYVILIGISIAGALMFSLMFVAAYYYVSLRHHPAMRRQVSEQAHDTSQNPPKGHSSPISSPNVSKQPKSSEDKKSKGGSVVSRKDSIKVKTEELPKTPLSEINIQVDKKSTILSYLDSLPQNSADAHVPIDEGPQCSTPIKSKAESTQNENVSSSSKKAKTPTENMSGSTQIGNKKAGTPAKKKTQRSPSNEAVPRSQISKVPQIQKEKSALESEIISSSSNKKGRTSSQERKGTDIQTTEVRNKKESPTKNVELKSSPKISEKSKKVDSQKNKKTRIPTNSSTSSRGRQSASNGRKDHKGSISMQSIPTGEEPKNSEHNVKRIMLKKQNTTLPESYKLRSKKLENSKESSIEVSEVEINMDHIR